MEDQNADLRRNAILALLPEDMLGDVRRRGEVVEAELRRQVYRPGDVIKEVYFPMSAVFSMVALADDGEVEIEVGTIGHEGMVGLPLFLGSPSSPHAAFCQVPGEALHLTAGEFRELLAAGGTLHQALNRFTQATMVQIAQSVACNSTHNVEQRACRWLLTTRDRTGRDSFPLTQQFLAQMLGVRRPTVSDVAGELQGRGLIRYHRGTVEITDSEKLAACACDCYRIVKKEFDDMLDGQL